MKPLRLSVRARLTAWYGGLFLLAGVALVVTTYLLVESRLPEAAGFAIRADEPIIGMTPAPEADVIKSLQEYRSSTMSTLLVQSAVALLITTAFAGLVGWVMASRVLQPLQSITTTAHRLEAGNLGQRINHDGPDDELKDLADTFDGMLDRLAAAFDSQRRFVANASHELRTPLAVQRTLIEVAMDEPDSPPSLHRLGKHLLDTNERSEKLIDGLLLLARSDRGLSDRVPVRLHEIAEDVVHSYADLASEREVRISSSTRPRVVEGDPVLLSQLIGNLVRNAIIYNKPGGSVEVEIGEYPTLAISNTGYPVPAEAVPGLFEPFRRLRTVRTAGSEGSGLGLSIVRSIASAHHGNAVARPNEGGGLLVEVNLPVTEVRNSPVYGKIT